MGRETHCNLIFYTGLEGSRGRSFQEESTGNAKASMPPFFG
jgi:hypothetical protein